MVASSTQHWYKMTSLNRGHISWPYVQYVDWSYVDPLSDTIRHPRHSLFFSAKTPKGKVNEN